MKMLWNPIDRLSINAAWKKRLFLFLNTLLFAVTGLALWFIVHFFRLNSPDWMICFSGYSAMFLGLFGGILFLFHLEN